MMTANVTPAPVVAPPASVITHILRLITGAIAPLVGLLVALLYSKIPALHIVPSSEVAGALSTALVFVVTTIVMAVVHNKVFDRIYDDIAHAIGQLR